MKKIVAYLLLTLLLLTSAVGCAKKETPTTASVSNDEPKFVNGKLTKEFHLKVPHEWVFDFTIAEAKGFFKEVGIVPEDVGTVKPAEVLPALIKGDINIMSAGHVNNIAAARKAGAKVKIVMEGMVDNPDHDKGHMFWLVKDDGKIKSPQDLIGKKIGVASLGICAELLTLDYLRQNNIPKDKVELVVMADKQQEQALRQGQIDVAVVHANYFLAAQSRPGLKLLINSHDIGAGAGDGEAGGLAIRAFSEDFITKHPDVVKAYIVANYRAQQWINANFEEAKKIYAKRYGVPVSGGNKMPGENHVDEKKVEFWLKLMEQNGWIKPGEVNAKDLYTNDLNPFLSGEVKE